MSIYSLIEKYESFDVSKFFPEEIHLDPIEVEPIDIVEYQRIHGGTEALRASEECYEALKRKLTGVPQTPEHVEKRISQIRGKPMHTDAQKATWSKIRKGVTPCALARQKSGEFMASRKGLKDSVVTCPHCNKSGGNSGMKRYHFDNCKSKP